MEAEKLIEPKKPKFEAGTRVCILADPKDPFTDYRGYRGRTGYVRCVRSITTGDGPFTSEEYLYLVTDNMPGGPGVGDWWTAVLEHDIAKV